jgi:predicted MFS family arabinose efflux permease
VLAGSLTLPIGRSVGPSHGQTAAATGWRLPGRLWPPLVAAGLFGAGFAAFFQFSPLLAERRGGVDAGLLYTVYGLAIILTRLLGGRWLDRVGVGPALLLASLLMIVGLSLAALTSGLVGLALAALLTAAGGGLFHPALLAYLANLLPGTPGRASAAFYLGFDLGIGLGSWLFCALHQVAGLTGLYSCAALLVALVLPLLPRLSRPPHPAAGSAEEIVQGRLVR